MKYWIDELLQTRDLLGHHLEGRGVDDIAQAGSRERDGSTAIAAAVYSSTDAHCDTKQDRRVRQLRREHVHDLDEAVPVDGQVLLVGPVALHVVVDRLDEDELAASDPPRTISFAWPSSPFTFEPSTATFTAWPSIAGFCARIRW